jgi:sterol 3beta-glucosyltransferase
LALRNNNCKAIVSSVGFEQITKNHLSHTDHVFYLTEIIPHSWLFPNISASIHHGGAGTTHASVRCGLPSLILSFGADQPFNGDRIFVKRLGPRHIPIRKSNVKTFTTSIHDPMIENYSIYAINARRIGELIRDEDGLGHCVRLIESAMATEDIPD